jgi:hypothetical protein
VIHHYNEAARIAPDQIPLRQRREATLPRLNNDEDYLASGTAPDELAQERIDSTIDGAR